MMKEINPTTMTDEDKIEFLMTNMQLDRKCAEAVVYGRNRSNNPNILTQEELDKFSKKSIPPVCLPFPDN